MIVSVNLGPRSYTIVVESGALDAVGERLRALGVGRQAALVTDAAIMRLHGATVAGSLTRAGFAVTVIEVPEGEAA
jgi:3-dehydroquinate synthase